MPNYLIPEQLLAAVITYLEGRPYKEVAPAVAALRGLPQHVEKLVEKEDEVSSENMEASDDK